MGRVNHIAKFLQEKKSVSIVMEFELLYLRTLKSQKLNTIRNITYNVSSARHYSIFDFLELYSFAQLFSKYAPTFDQLDSVTFEYYPCYCHTHFKPQLHGDDLEDHLRDIWNGMTCDAKWRKLEEWFGGDRSTQSPRCWVSQRNIYTEFPQFVTMGMMRLFGLALLLKNVSVSRLPIPEVVIRDFKHTAFEETYNDSLDQSSCIYDDQIDGEE
ncbi:hypothetical protein LTR84_011335 [Exophiala bonariae]|uniref:Uncharacterized protein n=1 Tax=Exophiala bonariae TaxID=1690606 RepID=A0AAV9MVI4_9EURO|nr:hypothetical protein LTR84_011335 [Exophiala bonariae]